MTLLYSARDEHHNQAIALVRYLKHRSDRTNDDMRSTP